ncbi:DUF2520 domain-containing protein [Agrococcus lahaulensis]|uniref:Rossmann-like and DUF2520 domain-containing protein n=1 Tax=Agrococcus TaxID=46352 RepID=UPI000FE2B16E|nr:DUF2520 domain-containing protein [Agrococcus sp. BE272]MDR7233465.1 putative short-subunit dehydrogenase-like oxidoreductase (DUF2520 family) [Agrococcus sp. BE272]RWR25395.1 DUF2520 domain-containing protein [Agrococcus lahaulensis]
MRPGRLGVGIIGAGRVGPVLGAALAGAGHAIVGIDATGEEAADRAEAVLPGVAILDAPTIVERSELVLIAVPSDELPGLVAGLAATGAWQPGQIVVHTAPEHGIEVLRPAAARGAIPIALHPAMTFSGTSLDLARLLEATIAVTAPGPVLPIGQALAVEMGGEPIVVEEADRPAYAEALEAARGFAEGIVAQALRQLHEIGIERPSRVLGGVVRSAVETALARYPDPPVEP